MSANQLTGGERRLAGKAGAHKSWAQTDDRAARTAAARAAADERFEKQADPDGVLPPQERARRAENLRAAFYAQIALKSAAARRSKKRPAA